MRVDLELCGGEPALYVWTGGLKRLQVRKLLSKTGPIMDLEVESCVWLTSFQTVSAEHYTEDPVQEWGEEMEDGLVYGVTLLREPMPTPDLHDSTSSQSCMQYRTLKSRRVKAASLERLVSELVKPECDEPDYARIFLSTYRAFTCPRTLIELLFHREDMISNLDSTVCVKSTLPPLVQLWLEEFWEDLRDPPEHQPLRLLCVHLRHRLCFRRLARQAEALLQTFKEEDRQSPTEDSGVCSASVENGPSGDPPTRLDFKDEGGLLSFSTQDIAEQLTRLDADLFVRVVPFHCLGCVWSQRDKKEKRSVAPTVRATIAQFNSVTSAVITSLLCPTNTSLPGSPQGQRFPRSPRQSPLPQRSITSMVHRARIIEKWISVAQECRQLRNFSSLHAILSALQSNAVYRLKNTWSAVSRESLVTFDQLCESFPDENCVLTTRELEDSTEEHTSPSKSSNLSPASRHTGCSTGEVPYLGTYLTALTMLDTALPDTVQGGLINFEKRRREFEILSQIRQLQASCALYCLPSHPVISSWLISCTALSDQQSYDLSRKLEPPMDVCSSSSPTWSQRLISKKLSMFLNSSESSLKKTHVDQISVSSSGSSGSEVEELSGISSPLRPKSQYGSCLNISADSGCSSPRCSSPISCTSSQLDLSAMSSDGASSNQLSSSSCLAQPPPSQPSCHRQGPDSCIIRISLEIDSGNVYKSILVTSQDKTSQVVQRALEKHNLEDLSYHEFSLIQILPQGKELSMPDKANVFYAMCPSDSYDFVLRQRWKSHCQTLNSSCPSAILRRRHAK